MSIDELLDKPVHSNFTSKATAKKIRRLSRGQGSLNWTLLKILSCYERAKNWEDLSPTELSCTNCTSELLSIGNDRGHTQYTLLFERITPNAE
jgi:hypothetical protein